METILYVVIVILIILAIRWIVIYLQGEKVKRDYKNSREYINRRNDFKKQIDKINKDKK